MKFMVEDITDFVREKELCIMTNKFFSDERITENDLYFLCYMIERVARKLCQRNRYVVNRITKAYNNGGF